ncbi:hypothetical protein NXS98_07345 [Fontisphaera persica]|uniref:hypothetical protein n=1 Tax=Fontisphaera persica TaxID=2974023 RepID=UPI0024BF9EEB|nr:hypothetical protein [Fontisphaera persica]WCJ60924.1 hypothetical protein NXS98_07345 [Fontisphaera persica]
MNPLQIKQAITTALAGFASQPEAAAATALFETLGYRSAKRLPLDSNTPEHFLNTFAQGRQFNQEHAMLTDWNSVDFLFQLTDDEVRAAGGAQQSLPFDSRGGYNGAVIESYLFFAIALKNRTTPAPTWQTSPALSTACFPCQCCCCFGTATP